MSFFRNVNSLVGFLSAVLLLMPGCTNFGSAVIDASSQIINGDTTAPQISFLTPEAYTAGDPTISISGSCETGLAVSIAGTGAVTQSTSCSSGAFSAVVTFSAGKGVKEISISQTDSAGNTGSASREFFRTTSMYYVSASGNDSNTGRSPSDAFLTITKVNSLTLAPGDVVGFRSGDTFSGTLNITTAGTSLSPITIASYGASRATINAGTGTGIYVHNVGGVAVHNINVTSPDRTLNTNGSGISFFNDLTGNTKLNYVRIDKVNVSGFGQSGISVGGWPADNSKSGYTDVRITNVVSSDNGIAGVNIFGYEDDTVATYAHSNVYIGRTIAHNNPGTPGASNNTGNGIVMSNVDTGTIEYSVAYENGADNDFAGGGPVGIWAWASTGITIQHNESHHNTSGTIDGGGFDFDGGMKNSIMQYNYSHNNKGAGFMVYQFSSGVGYDMTNLTVRYNISENDGVGSNYGAGYVAAAGGTSITGPVYYYNNTFYSDAAVTGPSTRLIYTNTNNTEFRYNIFVVNGGTKFFDVVPQTGQLFRGNNYWAVDGARSLIWNGVTHSSVAAWRSATGQETDSTADASSIVDPLLVNPGAGITLNSLSGPSALTSYKLQPLSAMIDTGEDISSVVGSMGNRDFFGNPTPARAFHDRGAYEAP